MGLLNISKIYAASSIGDFFDDFEDGAGNAEGVDYISTLLQYVIPISGVCVFVLLAFASYKLMLSKGDPDKLREAKDQITNAIVGFIFILLSATILVLLSHILGIDIDV